MATVNSANFSDGLAGQVLTSNGPATNPTFQAVSAAGAVVTIKGNDAVAEVPDGSGIFNFLTANSTVKFAGSANTETLDFGITNLVLGSSLPSLAGGTLNVGLGAGALAGLTSGFQNIAIGSNALTANTTGLSNTAVGCLVGNLITSSGGNTLVGFRAGAGLSTGTGLNTFVGSLSGSNIGTGNDNVAIGNAAIGNLTGPGAQSYNTAIGSQAGVGWGTGTEVSNIAIGYNAGTISGVNNTLYIGNATGSGNGQLNRAFICGIDGVNVGSVAKVVTMASNQLGTATITAGTNVSIGTSANTITVNALGGGAVAWSVISADQTAVVNNGYFCNKAGTLALALPAISAVGDVIEVANINTANGVQFTQAAGQQIFFSTVSTTLGATGTLTSTSVGDTLKMVCRTANLTWWVVSSIGNWTPA